jgi:osmoprotectant transport system ATP-binding protein
MKAVEFRGVAYSIAGRNILEDISFSVETGETLVLLGRSGSGKTTALRLINALLLPRSGEVLVEGQSTAECDPVRLRRGIGYVIQETGLFPHFTVARNVGLVPALQRWPQDKIAARVNELLDRVGLPAREFANRMPRELSGGQRQRIGVARALAADPNVLLFDEPFGALDPVTRLDLQNEFLRLRDEFRKTSIFVTHDVREAIRLGTRIALLDRGRLVFLGSPAQFGDSDCDEVRQFLQVLRSE